MIRDFDPDGILPTSPLALSWPIRIRLTGKQACRHRYYVDRKGSIVERLGNMITDLIDHSIDRQGYVLPSRISSNPCILPSVSSHGTCKVVFDALLILSGDNGSWMLSWKLAIYECRAKNGCTHFAGIPSFPDRPFLID